MRGELNHDQCDEVKIQVIDMFEECGVDSYPIDPFRIADTLYYAVRPYSSLPMREQLKALTESEDAYSRVEYNEALQRYEYVIYYNSKQMPNRIRWSLLHEIGHCYMGHHDNPDDSNEKVEEAAANLFAKYAIAPPPLVHILKLESWQDIARVFVTTDDAAENSYNYYQKWLQFGPQDYTDFEMRLLRLFKMAA